MSLTPLKRLKISYLLLGMMFWYGIEQLFLNKYLGTNSARAYLTMAYATSLLIFDIPCGMLADKIGRKVAMLASCLVQAVAVLVLGTSNTLEQYLIGSILFGLCISLLNGAGEALLYDYLKERGEPKQYSKHQGSVYAYFLVGAATANMISGFMAHVFGLRVPFFASAVPAVLAFFLLLKLPEPPFKKQVSTWFAHLGRVGKELRVHPRILVFGLQFIVCEVLLLTTGEFGQIYILHFQVSAVALGIIWSGAALSAAIGRFLSHRIQSYPRIVIGLFCLVLITFLYTRSAIGIVLFLILYGYNEAVANIAEAEVQDETASSLRATLYSTVSFAANLVALPIIFIFNRIYVHHSIFAANEAVGLLVVGTMLLTLSLIKRAPKSEIATKPLGRI